MTEFRMSSFRATPARALAFACLLALTACGTNSDEPEYVDRPVGELYNDAMDSMLAGNTERAARLFDEVDRQHPYSSWAAQAQIMSAYAHYADNRYDDALATLDRFIDLHPGHSDIAYAYYLRALSYYEQIADVGRDQRMTEDAMSSLREVVDRFPDSAYARDARLKIDLARDHLAGKEMDIGRYYLRNGHYLAAINRFQVVVDEYQTTTHVPEALHRLTEAYLALGITDEAQATASVLGYNYPGSEWYVDSYALLTGQDLTPEAQEGSWISRVWRSIL